MKDELGGKIIGEFAALRPKTCSFLTDDNYKKEKKQKAQKRTSWNQKDYKNWQLNLKMK